MRKSKLNGWPARRRYQRGTDRIARAYGFPSYRAMAHSNPVSTLREVLANGQHTNDADLFTTREVADAINGSPKVIREAAYRRMIDHETLPGEKARKLFFRGRAVRKYVNGFRIFVEEYSRVFRSEKLAINPQFARGEAVTVDRAMIALGTSRRGVRYYLSCGALKKVPCGHRTVLISRKSLDRLACRRLRKAQRQFETAKKRLEKILGGYRGALDHKKPTKTV
jgi:hypothetical protein